MRSIHLVIALASVIFTPSGMAKFEAHEWGTFTSLVGSDGITQNGMYHEDEELPSFVHGFGVTQDSLRPIPPGMPPPTRPPCRNKGCFADDFFLNNVITQKMETPVIYFYSDLQRQVDVNVRFPEGVVTETYPAPILTSPTTGDIREAASGNTTFRVDVLRQTTGDLPLVDSRNIYSHARNVASNLIRTNQEQEKFIFYRGIGRFQPRISITSENGSLHLNALDRRDEPQAMFLVYVGPSGQGQLLNLGAMPAGQSQLVNAQTISDLKARKVGVSGNSSREQLIAGLVASGLYRDEAVAMVDTWEHGYLRVPGLRLLYILPRDEVDEVLPLSITPAPESLERAFVGRIELLLDTEERDILNRILRERDQFQLASLGRFAEPILRRVQQIYLRTPFAPHEIRELLDRLVQQSARAGEELSRP